MNDKNPNTENTTEGSSKLQPKITLQQALNIGMQQHQAGDLAKAKTIYQQILQSQPNESVVLHLLGLVYSQLNQYAKAEKLIMDAIKLKPDFDEAHNNLGNILKAVGRLDEAVSHYLEAIKIKPGVAETHYNLAIAFENLFRLDEAVVHYEKAIQINPEIAEAFNNLAAVLEKLGRAEEAIIHYNKAIELLPNETQFYQNMGDLLKGLGQLDEAIEFYRKAITIEPEKAQVYRQLSNTNKNAVNEDDINNMEQLFNNTKSTEEQKMHLAFALGKAYDDLQKHQKSYDFIEQGNLIRRKKINFKIEEWEIYIEKLIQVFDKSLFDNHHQCGSSDKTAIFILGMPRSGTSLTEQILASHPDVHGAGESHAMKRTVNTGFKGEEYPESANLKNNEFFNKLADSYLKIIKETNNSSQFISDKMTGNFIYLGLIKLMFPNATIIHCKRDPLDTCLSIFKNYFSSEGHHYAYDQIELGRFYNSYLKLMKHWHKVLPGFIYDLQYENIVSDQKVQTQELLNQCNLEWNDACLNFHETKRSVNTASASQVRKPIYSDSVQSWKHYEQQLKPLIDTLKTD